MIFIGWLDKTDRQMYKANISFGVKGWRIWEADPLVADCQVPGT